MEVTFEEGSPTDISAKAEISETLEEKLDLLFLLTAIILNEGLPNPLTLRMEGMNELFFIAARH